MNYKLPYTIENCMGEKITFLEVYSEPDGERLIVENHVTPGHGPLMHTHLLQDECLTVVRGKIGYEILNQPAQYANEGETVLFERGVPHRFWNAGDEVLYCKGWVKPANTFEFFISAVFAAQNKSGTAHPEKFDAAYLLTRYASEYEIHLPWFVRKVVIPVTYRIGKLLGKYKHFEGAPEPVMGK